MKFFIQHILLKQGQLPQTVHRRSLRRSTSFKVTNFHTNQKPICNFLLANNTNLHPISHHFPIIAQHLIIAFDRGCLTLTYLFSVICNHRHKSYNAKSWILPTIFTKVWVQLQPVAYS